MVQYVHARILSIEAYALSSFCYDLYAVKLPLSPAAVHVHGVYDDTYAYLSCGPETAK